MAGLVAGRIPGKAPGSNPRLASPTQLIQGVRCPCCYASGAMYPNTAQKWQALPAMTKRCHSS
jgi:hypothetical protein